MCIRAVGGGDWHYDPDTGAGQRGIPGVFGLNNIGLLVRIQGRVLSGASGGAGPIVVDDGGGVPVSVSLPEGVTSPGPGVHAIVTGVVSRVQDNRAILATDVLAPLGL